MIEDFRLKVFVVMATERSFTRTAAVLGISQPAVSQHMAELEKQLDVKLFDRLKGETLLTSAGRVFFVHAQKIISDYQSTASLFSKLPESVVAISASEEVFDYLMSELFADFIAVHPEVTFYKTFSENADLQVSLIPDYKKRGTFALSFSPSESFAATRLYKMLTQLL